MFVWSLSAACPSGMWLIPSTARLQSPWNQSFYGNQGPRVHVSVCVVECIWKTMWNADGTRRSNLQSGLVNNRIKRLWSNCSFALHQPASLIPSHQRCQTSLGTINRWLIIINDLWFLKKHFFFYYDGPVQIDYFPMKMTHYLKERDRSCLKVLFRSYKDVFVHQCLPHVQEQ